MQPGIVYMDEVITTALINRQTAVLGAPELYNSGLTRWRWFRPGARPEARFACGSMVHFDLFSQKICTQCKFFVKKVGFFLPAGGGISYRVNDRVSPVINV
jgi:hypothetical protein